MNLILPDQIPMKTICSFAREGDEFERIYSLGEELGLATFKIIIIIMITRKGSFGEVYLCNIWKNESKVRNKTEYFAVKVIMIHCSNSYN